MHMDIIPMHISHIIMVTLRFMSAFLLAVIFPVGMVAYYALNAPLSTLFSPFCVFYKKHTGLVCDFVYFGYLTIGACMGHNMWYNG